MLGCLIDFLRMNKKQKCKIQIKGLINNGWSEWFEGFDIGHTEDMTILSGSIPDQSALYGLLNKIRDLGIELISVEVQDQDGGNHRDIDPFETGECS